jgi:hypothetical protein
VLNGGPQGKRVEAPQVFTIDCRDTAMLVDQTTVIGIIDRGVTDAWYASCTYEGKRIPWLVLGVLHAGMDRHDDWQEFRGKLVTIGGKHGCPGVAVRKFPPTLGRGDTAVGALCVDPAQSARVQKGGALDIVTDLNL